MSTHGLLIHSDCTTLKLHSLVTLYLCALLFEGAPSLLSPIYTVFLSFSTLPSNVSQHVVTMLKKNGFIVQVQLQPDFRNLFKHESERKQATGSQLNRISLH